MPLTGYLTAAGIESCLISVTRMYPAISNLIVLPERSWEGRVSRAIKIGKGTSATRPSILVIAARMHAKSSTPTCWRLCR